MRKILNLKGINNAFTMDSNLCFKLMSIFQTELVRTERIKSPLFIISIKFNENNPSHRVFLLLRVPP